MKPFGGQKLTPREKSGPRRRLRRKWDSISREAFFFFSKIYPPENSHENGKPSIWRCISYWKWWLFPASHLSFRQGTYTPETSHGFSVEFFKKNPLSSWSFFPLKMVGSTSFFGFSHENLGVKKPANGAFLADMLNFRIVFFGGGPSMFEGKEPQMWFLEPQPKWNPSHTCRFLGFSRWLCQKTLSFARGLSECNPGFFYSRMTRRCMPCQILVTFSEASISSGKCHQMMGFQLLMFDLRRADFVLYRSLLSRLKGCMQFWNSKHFHRKIY